MSGSFFIAPIVEGHGEVQAVPKLLHRCAARLVPKCELKVNPPLRVKAGSFVNDQGYFNKYVELAARKAKQRPNSCVFIILDCEDGCPRQIGPELMKRAESLRPDVSVIVVLAYREFETWFLTAARSIRGVCGLPADLDPPDNPEQVRNAKGWLSARMPQRYNETDHQLKLTEVVSFEDAMESQSFARMFDKLRHFFV